MRISIAAAALTVLATPRAEACINGVKMVQSEALQRIAAVEAAMRLEQYWFANLMIPEGKYGAIGVIEITDVRPRGNDDGFDRTLVIAQQVIEMRWDASSDDAAASAKLFGSLYRDDRLPRYAAWHAEALLQLGEDAEARRILRDLEARDVMPDAHAYAVLASLTSGEEQRVAAKRCRARTLVPSICGPAPTTI